MLRELARRQEQTDRQLKETEKRIRETDEQMNRRMGRFFDDFGDFVEGLAIPSIPELLAERKIKVLNLHRNASAHLNGETMEVDAIAFSNLNDRKQAVVVAEIKTKLTPKAVDRFLQQLKRFPLFFPEYAKKPLIGMIGGVKVPEDTANYAQRKGLFVMVPSGKTMALANKKGFTPRVWHP